MLDDLDVAAYKVASTDTTNVPMLGYIASKGRPVILSTGMSTMGEVENAVNALRDGGLTHKIVLLHCTSEYPAPLEEVNLRAISTLRHAFGCPVGFSDHTPGIGASPWAVVLGACVIEKHFTLDKSLPGPDHEASLEPQELAELVSQIHSVELALGDGIKRPSASEIANKQFMQKSVVARQPISVGQVITREDITSKRPGTGLAPHWIDKIVGRKASRAIAAEESIQLGDIQW
jgi:N,N'-diacetyllegionaminate synthase